MTRIVQRSFASGELAPEFWGQQDQNFYKAGAKTLRNVVVTKEGALRKRSGLEHVATVPGARLVRFGASDGSDFVVVLGTTGVRIFRDGVEQALNPPAWAAGLYPPFSFVAHDGATYSNYGAWTETEPGAEGSAWDTETYPQIPAWATEPQAAQLGDVLTLTLKGHEPFQVTRGPSGWSFGSAALAAPLKSISAFASGVTVTPTSAETLSDADHYARDWEWRVTALYLENGMWRETLDFVNVTLSCAMTLDFYPRNVSVANTGTGERIYRVYRGYNGLFGLVSEFSGATSDSSSAWDHGENPDTTRQPPAQLGAADLYEDSSAAPVNETALKPNAMTFWNQRMVIGGFTKAPAGLLIGGLDALLDFTANPMLDPGDTDGIDLTLACREQEEIRALVPTASALLVFTSRGEWVVGAQGTVTPRTLTAGRNSSRGIATLRPLQVGSHVLFTSRSGAVYALSLDSDTGEWAQNDLTALASHLFAGKKIVSWAYQQRPDSIVWCVLDDGSFVSLTYRPEAGVMAWAAHDTEGTALAVEVAEETATDTVYLLVQRTLSAGSTVTLERMRDVEALASVQDGFFMDAARTWPDTWGATPGLPTAGSYLPLGSGAEMTVAVGGVNYGLRLYGTARQALTLQADVVTPGAPGTATVQWTVNGTAYPVTVFRTGLQLLSEFCPTCAAVRGLTVQHLPGPATDPTDFVDGDQFTQVIAAAGMVNEQPSDFDKVQVATEFAGTNLNVFETVTYRQEVAVDAAGFFTLTESDAERVVYGLPVAAAVELLMPADQKGAPAAELLALTVRCETAGAPALLAQASDTSGGQFEVAVTLAEYVAGTDISRRSVDGTVRHALEGEVAGAIVQTYPYPLRILWVARDVEFQQVL